LRKGVGESAFLSIADLLNSLTPGQRAEALAVSREQHFIRPMANEDAKESRDG
jgi:hypothetical protein